MKSKAEEPGSDTETHGVLGPHHSTRSLWVKSQIQTPHLPLPGQLVFFWLKPGLFCLAQGRSQQIHHITIGHLLSDGHLPACRRGAAEGSMRPALTQVSRAWGPQCDDETPWHLCPSLSTRGPLSRDLGKGSFVSQALWSQALLLCGPLWREEHKP